MSCKKKFEDEYFYPRNLLTGCQISSNHVIARKISRLFHESAFRTYDKAFDQFKPLECHICCEMSEREVFSQNKPISQQNFLGAYIDSRLVRQHEDYALVSFCDFWYPDNLSAYLLKLNLIELGQICTSACKD